MTARSTTRPLVCVLLAISLCAPILAIAAPARNPDVVTELRAVAPSSALVLARMGARYDQARHRSSAPSVFVLNPLQGAVSDSGRLGAATEGRLPRSLPPGGPRTGRSPPSIS
jgi:hypothetical protein